MTPAKRGGRPKWRENSSRPGEKNSSVVEFRRRKRRRSVRERRIKRRMFCWFWLMSLLYGELIDDGVLLIVSLLLASATSPLFAPIESLVPVQNKLGNRMPSPSLHSLAN